MDAALFSGELVRLVAPDVEFAAEAFYRWVQDSEYQRLLDNDPARMVSVKKFKYNPRAIRSYEKAGFVVEGRARQFLNRDGRRWDLIYMGILREEWEKARGDWPSTYRKESG